MPTQRGLQEGVAEGVEGETNIPNSGELLAANVQIHMTKSSSVLNPKINGLGPQDPNRQHQELLEMEMTMPNDLPNMEGAEQQKETADYEVAETFPIDRHNSTSTRAVPVGSCRKEFLHSTSRLFALPVLWIHSSIYT